MSAKAGKYRLVAVRFDQIAGVGADGRPTGYNRFDQGDVLDLDANEAERLVTAGAVVPFEDEDDSDDEADAGEAGDRPRAGARVDVWRKYAAERGVDVEGLDKDDLIAAVDALDAGA